ncbi:MAG: RNA methyltransferase [Phycisphaeraceae bacterium]
MPKPTHLSSPANRRVKAVLKLREHRHRRRTGLFIAEGMRQVTRALAAGLVLRELYQQHDARISDPGPGSWAAQAEVFDVTPRVMKKMAYRAKPQGVIAVFEQPAWRLDRLPTDPATNDLWLVAVGIEKPGNLGAMARSAAGAAAAAMFVADAVVDPFHPNAIRASTGAVFNLPVIGDTTVAIVDWLRGRRARIFAATPHATAPYTDADLTGPVAVVIGAEDTGLGQPWLDAAATQVRIPLAEGPVDSLNAATAAAVLLFEATRQRSRQPHA